MPHKEYAIIVAGGSGSRMKTETPKQYLPVCGLPVLMHTIDLFYRYSVELDLVVVIPEKDIGLWDGLSKEYDFHRQVRLAAGGLTRFESVKNGLDCIGDTGLVAIHDGVRPLADVEIIAASYQIAAIHGSAIASVRLKDSIRITDKDDTRAVDRSRYRIIQTPQTFQVPLIKSSYRQAMKQDYTDDASVAEESGYKISLFEGSYRNIKITTPDDLLIAETLLGKRKTE